MTADFNRAAIKAAETIVRFNVRTAPVDPLPILEQMDNVLLISFADMASSSGIHRSDLIPMFGKNRDAVTSVHPGNKPQYVVAYDAMLPFHMIQRALARELGHIILAHKESSPENSAEAMCFAHHFLCPRPLVHSIRATGIRITEDMLGNLTGVFGQALTEIRKLPGAEVPSGLNCFVRSQFMPFALNFFNYYQLVMPNDGSAIADFGSFMDNYKEKENCNG